mgnify:CR=1 FL=1
MSIKFTANEIRYIALFENMTGAMVKDCIIDDEHGKVTFVVKNGELFEFERLGNLGRYTYSIKELGERREINIGLEEGHIIKGDGLVAAVHDAGAAFSEREGLVASALHLPEHEKPEKP